MQKAEEQIVLWGSPKKASLNGRAIKRWGKGPAIKEERTFFWTWEKKILWPLSPRGGGGKALMARPLREEIFLPLPLVAQSYVGNLETQNPIYPSFGPIYRKKTILRYYVIQICVPNSWYSCARSLAA